MCSTSRPSAADKRKVSYAEIARLEFSGKDRAAGKHWEDWVKAYNEKKGRRRKEHRACTPRSWSSCGSSDCHRDLIIRCAMKTA